MNSTSVGHRIFEHDEHRPLEQWFSRHRVGCSIGPPHFCGAKPRPYRSRSTANAAQTKTPFGLPWQPLGCSAVPNQTAEPNSGRPGKDATGSVEKTSGNDEKTCMRLKPTSKSNFGWANISCDTRRLEVSPRFELLNVLVRLSLVPVCIRFRVSVYAAYWPDLRSTRCLNSNSAESKCDVTARGRETTHLQSVRGFGKKLKIGLELFSKKSIITVVDRLHNLVEKCSSVKNGVFSHQTDSMKSSTKSSPLFPNVELVPRHNLRRSLT